VAFKEFKSPTKSGSPAPPQTNGSRFGMCGRVSQMNRASYRTPLIHPEAARRRRARDWFLETLDYADCRRREACHDAAGVRFETEARSVFVATDLR